MAQVPLVTLSSGDRIPILGFGTFQSKPGEVANAVKCAIDAGYRHIDCAFAYDNENEVGEGISAKIADGTVKREDLFIVSKLWNIHHRPDLVRTAVEISLKKLKLDYLDMYLMHWPFAYQSNLDVIIPKDADGNIILEDIDYVDTYKAMEECHAAGLIRNLGVSNFNSKQIQRLLDECSVKPVSNQVEVHPYFSSEKLQKFCEDRGILLTAYAPLGSPKRPWGSPEEPVVLDDPQLKELAQQKGKSPAQISLRWLIQRGIIVIPKSVTPSRIRENINVFNFELSADEMATVSSLNRNWRGVTPLETVNGKRLFKDRNVPNFPFFEEF